ncbi:hypothetical protein HP398_04295 [Brevibacillus sp. HB1.4B]|uniref:hypothetical protein n=1 Tax=Brevibacillus sp. HB1.4B TaxID=2738845 RepID=UPI00156AC465|nr:hypothetical protein [Brevibacillus sp. HB1.4B]NRS15650.1 hypothetical protein [Brevibacillus sp. HB1.4B]
MNKLFSKGSFFTLMLMFILVIAPVASAAEKTVDWNFYFFGSNLTSTEQIYLDTARSVEYGWTNKDGGDVRIAIVTVGDGKEVAGMPANAYGGGTIVDLPKGHYLLKVSGGAFTTSTGTAYIKY